MDEQRGGCCALGVAMVSPGLAYRGPLSGWSKDLQAQRALYKDEAAGAAYVIVHEVYPLCERLRLRLRVDNRGREVRIQLTNIIFDAAALQHQQHGGVFNGVTPPRLNSLCIQLPVQLADDVMRGIATKIVVLDTWCRIWADFPPIPSAGGHAPPPAAALTLRDVPSRIQWTTDLLLAKATVIINSEAPGDARENLTRRLEEYVTWAQRYVEARDRGGRKDKASRARWSSRALTFFFRAACEVKKHGRAASYGANSRCCH